MNAVDWRDRTPDLVAAGVVLALGLLECLITDAFWASSLLLVVGTAAAVALARRESALTLALVWMMFVAQMVTGTPVLLTELALAYVAFALARWGSTATVVASGVSIPVAAVVPAVLLVFGLGYGGLLGVYDRGLFASAPSFGGLGTIVLGVLAVAVLGVPWLAGLAVRATSSASTSREFQTRAEQDAARAVHDAEQAREIARLREEQARLARDVHDVVGHSLAVILAQAESAQFLGDDPAVLRATMATIATSARTSLQDVRQVLTGPAEGQQGSGPGSLMQLVDGLRASGHDVRPQVIGTPRPLPPELETVAYRVLQEMLTNAIRHGTRDRPVLVELHWEGDLRIEVRNTVAAPSVVDETQPLHLHDSPGQGVEGMRRRLESVGGRLDVRRREETGATTFTATAWVPVRPAGG